jgi:hypothetical protein
MKVEAGQIWESIDKEFRVIEIVEIERNTWVHYIQEKTGQEYSCYLESFVNRFKPVLNR